MVLTRLVLSYRSFHVYKTSLLYEYRIQLLSAAYSSNTKTKLKSLEMYAGSDSTKVDLDKEYSPSWNSIRFKDVPDRAVENFVEIATKETERVRAKYQVKRDISYADQADNQLLDIYFKEKERGTPIFVFIHGGYWQFLDKSSSGTFVALFVERGYRVINVDYNLCPNVTLEQLCAQMWNFYKWLYKYAQETDAPSIAICGHSAGALLTALMFQEDALPLLSKYPIKTSFVLICGVYDLRELLNLESANPNNILGLTAESAAELSPICWTLSPDLVNFYREHDKKIYIIVSEHESTTFIEQSRVLSQKLSDLDLNVFFKIFEKYDHFDIVEESSKADSPITKYLLEILGA